MIEGNPYVASLAQYDGIGPGRLTGSQVIADNPPSTIGNADVGGILAATAAVNGAIFRPGSPGVWLRPAPAQPLYVVFVPQEAVDGNLVNNGYHAAVPLLTSWLDPFGIVQLPLVPYALIKVPMSGSASNIDATTVTLSHETIETATDPFDVGWRQPHPPAHEQGELADICWEGSTAPFAPTTRVAGVAVSTYWSQSAHACVPANQPVVTITQPTAGATIPWGPPVVLRATAVDPFDGPLPEASIAWTIDGHPVTLDSLHSIPTLAPGPHTAVATATDNRGAGVERSGTGTSAPVQFTVGPMTAFSAWIVTPADFAQIGDAFSAAVTFTAGSSGGTDVHYTWRDDVDGPLGSGQTIHHTLTGGLDFQRTHHVTVTATDSHGRTASKTITVLSGYPG